LARDIDIESPAVLVLRFGHELVRFISSVEKSLHIVIGLIAIFVIIMGLNVSGVLDLMINQEMGHISDKIQHLEEEGMLSEHTKSEIIESAHLDESVDVGVSIALVLALIPLIIVVLRSKRSLEKWNEIVEKNAIQTSMNIAMKNRSKEEVLFALTKSIGEISIPLYRFLEKSSPSKMCNIKINERLDFDIFLDKKLVENDDELIQVLDSYGSIIVKIVNSQIERDFLRSYINEIENYVKETKVRIGLVIIIGDSIAQEAHDYSISVSKKRIGQIILIDKPIEWKTI